MMKTSTCIGFVIAVFISFFQVCPAPPAVVLLSQPPVIGGLIGAAGAIIGGIAGAAMITSDNDKDRRDLAAETAALFIERYPEVWKACKGQLGTTTVTISPAGYHGARFDGVPPACMALANDYLGENPDPNSAPIVLGVASLVYDNLTSEELDSLRHALEVKAAPNAARAIPFQA